MLSRRAIKVVDTVLDVGIDGKGPFASASRVADTALRKSGGDVEKAIDHIVRTHTVAAGSEGFLTGLGGFVTLPVALPANVIAFYAAATRMTAAIARLRGHDIDREPIRAAVLLTLVGADAEDLLRKAHLPTPPGGRFVNLAAQRLPGPVEMVVKKGVYFRMVAGTTKTVLARLGRGVPLAGGVIGAGVDIVLLRRIASDARREFPPATPQIQNG
ncbi:EcsC family protein [Phycicoccus sp. CSK15P-2]|nr:EcsC family protein [Phycicoccus sp. CSK15P-2]